MKSIGGKSELWKLIHAWFLDDCPWACMLLECLEEAEQENLSGHMPHLNLVVAHIAHEDIHQRALAFSCGLW
jgi:hypothetical protein